ncbi:unnamed protein product [Calypogeia fissa]
MATPDHYFATWNVRGLCSPNRKWMVRNWLRQLKFPISILALQEIKADAFCLDVALRTILPDFQHLSSAPDDGRGGTALLIHPDFQIRNSGTLSQGRAVWAQLEKEGQLFGVACIYGPDSACLRASLWHELKLDLPRDNWIFLGDFNMTEHHRDTTGGHNLMKGWELEAWRRLRVKHGLKDCLEELGAVTGTHFTWRRRRGNSLEQSRIDRVYMGEEGWWLPGIRELIHDGEQSLSDHDPVILKIALESDQSNPPARPRYNTFFKAKAAILKSADQIARLKQAWEDKDTTTTCPHRIWDSACKRLRHTYISLQNAPKTDEEYSRSLCNDLRELKSELLDQFTQEALEEFLSKEQELRDIEEEKALHIRQLSRIRWLGQGDEPSRFFFRTLQAKQQRETMKELLLDNGTLITDPTLILEEVTRQCHSLYSPDTCSEQESILQAVARRKLLSGVRHQLTPAERRFLEEPPSASEVKEVLDMLPNDKAPGMDGLTAEVFRACWDFMHMDLLLMVLDFWHTSSISHTIKEGILKLIPKKADKWRFKDWRPLTMLTTIYKLIAKLLALRLKSFFLG